MTVSRPENKFVKPIFIFSLPRSGSTLLQNMLASHPKISTTPEPWILLPVFYALRETGAFTEYNHTMSRKAIEDFCQSLPNGRTDYYEAINIFGKTLYKKLSQNNQLFIDKTPRYHVISEEIIKAFPEGKFIVLFRNPLSILASIISTWKPIHLYRFDLYMGLENLLNTAEKFTEKVSILRFEDLVDNPIHELQKLSKYLDIKFLDEMITSIAEDIVPREGFGNPTRYNPSQGNNYKEISREPIDKWKYTLSENYIRISWGRRYLRWIGKDRLHRMGYDYSKLMNDLENLSVGWRNLGGDSLRIVRGKLSIILESEIIRQKLKKLPNKKEILPHQ